MIQVARLLLAGDEEVEPAIVVVVGPGRRVGIERLVQPGLGRHVGESSAAVVAEQRGPDRVRQPRAARDEQVEAAVVVVIGLVADQAAELAGHAGRLTAVLERPISPVVVERHRLGRVHRRDRQVEPAIAVEVVHDRAAGLVEAIHARIGPDIPEPADVELG